MKLVLGLILIMSNVGIAQAKMVEYICTSDESMDFRLKVSGAHGRIFTITDMDETAANTAVVDEAFITPVTYYKRLKSLGGNFSLIGDGSTELLLERALIQGADVGKAKYQIRNRISYDSVIYKCNRIVKI
jgi:hypothetical protein